MEKISGRQTEDDTIMKKNPLKPISNCRTYSLNWDYKGQIDICLLETGDRIGYLEENSSPILRAVFSRDMRRILCQNHDGSVCVWSMPPRNRNADLRTKNIVEYLDHNNYGCEYTVRRKATSNSDF